MSDTRELMTATELSLRLRMSQRSLRRWVAQGLVPPPVLPHRWLRSEIDDLLKTSVQFVPNSAHQDTDQ